MTTSFHYLISIGVNLHSFNYVHLYSNNFHLSKNYGSTLLELLIFFYFIYLIYVSYHTTESTCMRSAFVDMIMCCPMKMKVNLYETQKYYRKKRLKVKLVTDFLKVLFIAFWFIFIFLFFYCEDTGTLQIFDKV